LSVVARRRALDGAIGKPASISELFLGVRHGLFIGFFHHADHLGLIAVNLLGDKAPLVDAAGGAIWVRPNQEMDAEAAVIGAAPVDLRAADVVLADPEEQRPYSGEHSILVFRDNRDRIS